MGRRLLFIISIIICLIISLNLISIHASLPSSRNSGQSITIDICKKIDLSKSHIIDQLYVCDGFSIVSLSNIKEIIEDRGTTHLKFIVSTIDKPPRYF